MTRTTTPMILGLISDDSGHMWVYLLTWGLLFLLIVAETFLLRKWKQEQEAAQKALKNEVGYLWKALRAVDQTVENLQTTQDSVRGVRVKKPYTTPEIRKLGGMGEL